MTRDDELEFQQMWKDRVPIAEIARKLGYTKSYLLSHASNNRDKFPRRVRTITKNKKELWICRIKAKRCTQSEAAKKLGVSQQTVKKWLEEYDDEGQ